MGAVIQIDKDIPIPSVHKSNAKYPWQIMQVGDSFWTPASLNTMRTAFRRHKPRRFICIAERDGVRVWRVE